VLHKLDVEKSVHELALERIRECFRRYDHVAVAFSGGKDSTVVLNLTLQVAHELGRTPLDVIFYDEEAQAPDTIDYVARVRERPDVALRWLCLPVRYHNACSQKEPWFFPWAEEDRHRWVREMPPWAVTEHDLPGFERIGHTDCNRFLFPREWGSCALLLGVRAQESMMRLFSVTHRTVDNWIHVDPAAPHVYRCKPIYDWVTEDVWTAPHTFGWDYNRAYDRMAAAGISPATQRIGMPYGEESLNALWMYALCWPERWEAMQNRVHGGRTAGRYALSPMYGTDKSRLRGPQNGQSWEERIRELVMNHDESSRPHVAKTVQRAIRYWNKRTGNEPIIDDYWRFIMRIASRGDFKGRTVGMAMGQVPVEMALDKFLHGGD
jgi:predicted phosphoadenosine phosphosulfate sulfurtransferase